ncbi:DNA cytosine methyltransferase [Alcanivorax sp.]|uniref:DNA cytosine methyltransferase n=1 Tax=Alcanivorax sp. TaxID=1872427 RepID=UPI0025C4DCEB|nr:DNA cytosine methyltransferase [Alcanivorax sp.]
MNKIKVLDLFAGPGGLGEGFTRFSPRAGGPSPFNIVFSAEKTPPAVRTLRLRTFYRLCRNAGDIPQSYFEYLEGNSPVPYDHRTAALWEEASGEALPLELGTSQGDEQLNAGLRKHINPEKDDWVLIGGPPCQAYSLAGRSRNKGVKGYTPEKDNRHFLYREYLKILAGYRPAAFVMENVKGILSSRIGNERIFPQILKDLTAPGGSSGVRYRIHSLVTDDVIQHGDDPDAIDLNNFIIRSEDYGIPQARHRVILLGIRDDGPNTPVPKRLEPSASFVSVRSALHGLPPLRSGLSRNDQGEAKWKLEIRSAVISATNKGVDRETQIRMRNGLQSILDRKFKYDRGGQFVGLRNLPHGHSYQAQDFLARVQNPRLQGVTNHFSRGHMPSDLARYLFASTFAERGYSPKANDYPASLAPDHKNWKSGNFADRFRVQLWDSPSTTVVSHISKDGHYFIHPDPSQCRSLTVREAARLQTFPDDYFFEGNRTEQYVQVGNAVPPMLAEKIAKIVFKVIG